VVWDEAEGEQGIEGQMVLMATGRKPYTRHLGLAELGVKIEGPAIVVDEYLETNVKDIYAIGDVTGRHMLAHVASYEGEVAVENALGRSRQADYSAVPSCVFVQPEVAYVGITEAEAKERDIPYKVSKFPFLACGRAVAMGETAGLVKLICDADNGKVLGMHIMGPHASDLIAEGALAMRMGATAKDIAHTIHAHPTVPEAVQEAAMGQLDGSIHFRRM
jgi:dihydrolipoamide dehydrogenase